MPAGGNAVAAAGSGCWHRHTAAVCVYTYVLTRHPVGRLVAWVKQQVGVGLRCVSCALSARRLLADVDAPCHGNHLQLRRSMAASIISRAVVSAMAGPRATQTPSCCCMARKQDRFAGTPAVRQPSDRAMTQTEIVQALQERCQPQTHTHFSAISVPGIPPARAGSEREE